MKKSVLFFLMLPLFALPIFALSLQLPLKEEVVFEPNKDVTLSYAIGNDGMSALPVKVVFDTGALPFTVPSYTVDVPARSSAPAPVQFKLPEQLSPGIYPLVVAVVENTNEGGTVARIGMRHVFNIISPFASGHPNGNIRLPTTLKPDQPINFVIEVQNIGKITLQNLKGKAELFQNNEKISESETNTIDILSLADKTKLNGQLKPVQAGIYELRITLDARTSDEVVLKERLLVGNPQITVANKPSINAGEPNEFSLNIILSEWNAPINAPLKIQIGRFFNLEKTVSLLPGTNEISFSGIANPGKGGVYIGFATITGEGFLSDARFEADVKGSPEIQGRLAFQKTVRAEQENELETPPIAPQPATKNRTFLVVMLVASLVIFSFSLGQYLARRRENYEPPTK